MTANHCGCDGTSTAAAIGHTPDNVRMRFVVQ
jgi:hypothetical protein